MPSESQTKIVEFGKDGEKLSYFDRIRENNFNAKSIVSIPKPFLKWAGGKRQLISQIHPYLPNKYNKYIEMFVGGGALYFYLLPNEAIINDINSELINCYKAIKNNPKELILNLRKHRNNEAYFKEVREWDRSENFLLERTPLERASRTIFLNRCCFNGLYRVNSKGQFNVSFGSYKDIVYKLYVKELFMNLKLIQQLLKNTTILNSSFEVCVEYAEKDDLIFIDPPYHPISDTSSFKSYDSEGFGEKEQEELFKVYKKLDAKGCILLLTNSYCDYILDLYSEFNIKTLSARRNINSDASKRSAIKEVLVLNK